MKTLTIEASPEVRKTVPKEAIEYVAHRTNEIARASDQDDGILTWRFGITGRRKIIVCTVGTYPSGKRVTHVNYDGPIEMGYGNPADETITLKQNCVVVCNNPGEKQCQENS